jgi:hypothetical protein
MMLCTVVLGLGMICEAPRARDLPHAHRPTVHSFDARWQTRVSVPLLARPEIRS